MSISFNEYGQHRQLPGIMLSLFIHLFLFLCHWRLCPLLSVENLYALLSIWNLLSKGHRDGNTMREREGGHEIPNFTL